MIRLAFFIALAAFLIMAVMPMRMKALSDYGHSYAAQEEFYFSCLAELEDLKAKGSDENKIHQSMIKVAKELTLLRKYEAADRILKEVLKARTQSMKTYDQILVAAMMARAGLRRDASDDINSISLYSQTLSYDKKYLSANDERITRDKTNLAVAMLIVGSISQKQKRQYLAQAAGYLLEAIAEQKERAPGGSLREANLHQELAYALESMADRPGYEKELERARRMHVHFLPGSRSREP